MAQIATPLIIVLVFGVASVTAVPLPCAAADIPQPTVTPPTTVKLDVWPTKVRLDSRDDTQRLVAQATLANGAQRDVSEEARWELADAKVARLDGPFVRPLSVGSTRLLARYQDQTCTVEIHVSGMGAPLAPSFRRDVLPVLTKAGCNRGACHGAARGKDGFRLSLLGYDPEADIISLTRELPGRRVNVFRPEASLLLLKATGQAPHTGGALITQDSAAYKTLLRWLAAGAPSDAPSLAGASSKNDSETLDSRAQRANLEPVGLDVFPREVMCDGPDVCQQLVVRARYADGSHRDVTELARFKSTDPDVAQISTEGLVTSRKRGETQISVAFGSQQVGCGVYVVPGGPAASPTTSQPGNFIDRQIHAKLARLRLTPTGPCDDTTFVRRVTLDLAGRLPTSDEIDRFLADSASDRRTRLIDALLEAPEFIDVWTMHWADLLQIRSKPSLSVSFKGSDAYVAWVRRHVERNTPVDEVVKQLLTASGSGFAVPQAHFYLYETDTLSTAENVAQAFLGVRLKCARCHNHPFDRWTMDDYYSFAAFFARIERKKGFDFRDRIVVAGEKGEVENPLRKQAACPKFLGGDVPDVQSKDRRAVLADWLVAPENPWFARHWANLVWSRLFGAGLIEPVDDHRFSNPPSNAELLDALTVQLVEQRFDLRRLIREICLSEAYQRSSVPTEPGPMGQRYLAVWPLRRLRSEVLFDAIAQATGAPVVLPQAAAGSRAVQLHDGALSNYFLETFGRATRRTVCACEVKTEPTLSQSLHLINGDTIHENIKQGGLVGRWLAEGKPRTAILDELYLRCLARKPTAEELADFESMLRAEDDSQAVLEDMFWVLLNCREFVFQH